MTAKTILKIPPAPRAELFYRPGEVSAGCFVSITEHDIFCLKKTKKGRPKHAWDGDVVFAEPIQIPDLFSREEYLKTWSLKHNIRLIPQPDISGAQVYYIEQLPKQNNS